METAPRPLYCRGCEGVNAEKAEKLSQLFVFTSAEGGGWNFLSLAFFPLPSAPLSLPNHLFCREVNSVAFPSTHSFRVNSKDCLHHVFEQFVDVFATSLPLTDDTEELLSLIDQLSS